MAPALEGVSQNSLVARGDEFIRDAGQLTGGERVTARFSQGSADCQVIEIHKSWLLAFYNAFLMKKIKKHSCVLNLSFFSVNHRARIELLNTHFLRHCCYCRFLSSARLKRWQDVLLSRLNRMQIFPIITFL